MDWLRVNRTELCKICGQPDWCTYTSDLALCMRVESNRPAKNNGGWIHRLTDAPFEPIVIDKPIRKIPSSQQSWQNRLDEKRSPTISVNIRELASIIGVDEHSLDRLEVGYDGKRRCWWMPERDETGLVIGINRRFRDGKKICEPGSNRGLTFAMDWFADSDPIMIVEGATDTAAVMSAGLSAIGRPSNIGGTEMLMKLLFPYRWRTILVVGENDFKPHDTLAEIVQERHKTTCRGCLLCWPGKYGAMKTIAALSTAGIKSEMILPPTDKKDFREWMNSP